MRITGGNRTSGISLPVANYPHKRLLVLVLLHIYFLTSK